MSRPKVAVIGAGNWGKNLVQTLHGMGCLGAVVETDPAKAHPDVPNVASLAELPPDIRAVAIATPVPTHFAIAKDALERGLDVFVEKPITMDSAEAEALDALAREKGRVLMVGHLLLYQAPIRWIASFLKEGGLGKLHSIRQERLKLGRARAAENVLWSFGVHDIAVLLGLVGETPTEVSTWGVKALQKGIEDEFYLHLAFPSGVKSTLHVSWLWPTDTRSMTLVGEKGMLVFDEKAQTVTLHKKRIGADLQNVDEGSEVVFSSSEKPLLAEMEHFVSCVETRAVPVSDGKNGVEVLKVLERARKKEPAAKEEYKAHASAFVDEGAVVGRGTRIWHFSHVSAGAVLGEKCSLGQNVFVAPKVRIGNNVKIQNNVSVYEGVDIEDDVFCGPSMVFTNVRTPRSAFPRNTSADYHTTKLGRGASIGANATIVCGTSVAPWTFVAAGAVVTKDTVPYSLMAGVPAKRIGWACACGVTLKFQGPAAACGECKREYQLKGETIERLDALKP